MFHVGGGGQSLLAGDAERILFALEKAMAAGDASAVALVKEDLELEAYTSLYTEADENEFRMLKSLPRKTATSITHEFTRYDRYGIAYSSGFFPENQLPPESDPTAVRATISIKLMGSISRVFALPSFETPVQAFGKGNLVDQHQVVTRLNLMDMMNRAVYASRTDEVNGNNTLRFKGLKQQIDEGTANSPFTHAIDMRGRKLKPFVTVGGVEKGVREVARQIAENKGRLTSLMLSPKVHQQFETELDGSERLHLNRPSISGSERINLLANVSRINAGGGDIALDIDNGLTVDRYRGKPPTTTDTTIDAPANVTALAEVVLGAGETSLWELENLAELYYYVSYTKDDKEGPKTRAPGGANSYVNHNDALKKTTVTIIDPTWANLPYHSIKIYRGTNAKVDPGNAMLIAERPFPTAPGNFVFSDLNQRIPGTDEVFGLTLAGHNYNLMRQAQIMGASYQTVQGQFNVANHPTGRNSICLVNLGPWMGIFALAPTLFTASHDLLFTAFAPEVAVPTHNVYWYNVGTSATL